MFARVSYFPLTASLFASTCLPSQHNNSKFASHTPAARPLVAQRGLSAKLTNSENQSGYLVSAVYPLRVRLMHEPPDTHWREARSYIHHTLTALLVYFSQSNSDRHQTQPVNLK